MKRLFSFAVAAVMAMSLSLGAMAAGSKTDVTEIVTATTGNGTGNVQVTLSDKMDVMIGTGTTNGVDNTTTAVSQVIPNISSATVLDQFDLTAPVEPTTADPLFVTFSLPSVDANTHVLHYNTSTKAWEDVSFSRNTEANTITARFNSLSPVAIVQVTPTTTTGSTTTPSTNSNTSSTGSTAASPKTGESAPVLAISIFTIACLGAYAVAGKKHA